MFTDGTSSPSAAADRSLKDNKNLESFGLSNSHTSNSNLDVGRQLSTLGLDTSRSSSESNLHHVNPAEITPFLQTEQLRVNRSQKTKESAVLADTAIEASLAAEAEARAKPVKCNRLFRYNQEKSRKPKQLNKNVRRVDSFEEEDEPFGTECAKPYSMFTALTKWFQCTYVTNGPTTVAPDSATSVSVATAALMTALTTAD
jgi:hypothetical protein